jgi:hypothetical protein
MDGFALTHDYCEPGRRKISDDIQPYFCGAGATMTSFHSKIGIRGQPLVDKMIVGLVAGK